MLSISEFMGDREEQAGFNHHVSEKVCACLCVHVCDCVSVTQKMRLKWRTSWGSYNLGAVIISVDRAYFSISYFFILSIESSPVHPVGLFYFPTCECTYFEGDQRGIQTRGFRIAT